MGMAEIGDQLVDRHITGVDGCGLVLSGEESVGPKLGADDRTSGGKGNVAGEVAVFRTEPIGYPASHGRADRLGVPRLHDKEAGFVVGLIRVHGADDAEVVRMSGKVGEEFAHDQPALPVLGERKRAGHIAGALGLASGIRRGFSFMLGQGGLGVEGIYMGWAAVHEQEDDALGFRGMVGRRGSMKAFLSQCTCEANRAEACAETGQCLAAGKKWEWCLVHGGSIGH